MWWAGSTVDAYVGTRAVALGDGSTVKLAATTDGVEEGLGLLRQALGALPGRISIRVWLSGGICRPFIVAPLSGVRNQMDVRRIAHALAAQETGLPGPCEIWLEERDVAGVSVAVAIQSDQFQAITKAVQDRPEKTRIKRVAPWWTDALRAALTHQPDIEAMTVRDCDSLVVLASAEKEFVVASAMTPVVDEQAAEDACARLLMMHAVEPRKVARLHFEARETQPHAWSDAIALGCLTTVPR